MNMKFAFDRSMRSTDADGRLHIAVSHISRVQIAPYMGKEIPGYKELGLEPDRIYKLLRSAEELEKGAQTFARLPILSDHVPVTVDAPQPDLVIGAIGSDIKFNSPYLDADLCFWDATAIAGIDTGKVKELSCAYRYVPVMEPGEYEGQPFDGVMTKIQGNHLCLVEIGRAGPDVFAADSNPFTFEEKTMKMTKLGKALFAAICAASPIVAADSAMPALFANVTKKDFKRAEVKTKLLALDASLDSNKLDMVLDAIMDVEQDPKPTEPVKPVDPAKPAGAADESPCDKVRAMLAGKVDDAMIEQICAMMAAPAADSDVDDAEPDANDAPVAAKDMKAAMDASSKALRKQLLEAQDAAREVRSVVGDVIGMDSAADIYAFALDHMKIEHKDIKDANALRALFNVASANKPAAAPMAHDAGGLATRFPNAVRFKSA